MSEAVRTALERILVEPCPADLWDLQRAILLSGHPAGARARVVARAFHACLRALESKSASRTASRWAAVLGTAAVGTVNAPELGRAERTLESLLVHALPAALEVGSALQSAQAWEIEAQLLYDDFAWVLYDELWDLSAGRDDLTPAERRARIDELMDPLLDVALSDAVRARLVVDIFRAVLAARVQPLLDGRG